MAGGILIVGPVGPSGGLLGPRAYMYDHVSPTGSSGEKGHGALWLGECKGSQAGEVASTCRDLVAPLSELPGEG